MRALHCIGTLCGINVCKLATPQVIVEWNTSTVACIDKEEIRNGEKYHSHNVNNERKGRCDRMDINAHSAIVLCDGKEEQKRQQQIEQDEKEDHPPRNVEPRKCVGIINCRARVDGIIVNEIP